MVTAALFALIKTWKQLVSITILMSKENVVNIGVCVFNHTHTQWNMMTEP